VEVPEEQPHDKINQLISALHGRFSHASAGELKRISKLQGNSLK